MAFDNGLLVTYAIMSKPDDPIRAEFTIPLLAGVGIRQVAATNRNPVPKAVFYPIRFDLNELLVAQTAEAEHELDRRMRAIERSIAEAGREFMEQRTMYGWPDEVT